MAEMKLGIVVVTFNRLAYTQRTLKSLNDTISVPHILLVCDNGSSDGTADWLRNLADVYTATEDIGVNLNNANFYPGKATNQGWKEIVSLYPNVTHLMRCDNDMEFQPGWDIVVAEYFAKVPELGQLGLDHEAIETPEADAKKVSINGMELNMWPGCIGGPCVIPREVWDKGIRYDESPWSPDGPHQPDRPPMQEDSKFTWDIINRGYYFGHIQQEVARTFATKDEWHEYPEYYKKSMAERGYPEPEFK